MSELGFSTIDEALDALRAGRPVLVLDDEDRENEGDVILAAETTTAEWMGWTVRYTSGVICAPLPEDLADRLELPPMVSRNEDPRGTAYTISVDAREGVSTGISAADRTRTVRLLADESTQPRDLVRPGHVFPLRAKAGGVLERAGHTEAAVDLARLAGLSPVGVIAELVHDDGEMMRTPAVLELGEQFDLPVITIEQLATHRIAAGETPAQLPLAAGEEEPRVMHVDEARLPTRHGQFTLRGYRDTRTGSTHAAIIAGDPGGEGRTLVRVHSECLTGDAFGSLRCDCGPQLDEALGRVAAEGGVVVYLRGHEGRGIGLGEKIRAYAVQDAGADTVDAQTALGLPIDARDYQAAAAILRELGVERISLLTNNPDKVETLRSAGLDVQRVATTSAVTPENRRYLEAKRDRMGHDITTTTATSTTTTSTTKEQQ